MPDYPLPNCKHEQFLKELISGRHRSAAAAYRIMYPAASQRTSRQKAYEILQRTDVQRRLDDLTGRAERNRQRELRIEERAAEKVAERLAEKIVVTREQVLEMLVADRASAREAKQFSAAVRASELLGKEVGMFVDRSERNLNVKQIVSDKPLTAEEWLTEHTQKPAEPVPDETKPAVPRADIAESDTKH